MLRELLTGLVVVFMASSVIISSVFRSTRSDKHQLPVKNINGSASITDKREIKDTKPGFDESNSKPKDV